MWQNEKALLFTVIFILLVFLGLVGRWDIEDEYHQTNISYKSKN